MIVFSIDLGTSNTVITYYDELIKKVKNLPDMYLVRNIEPLQR